MTDNTTKLYGFKGGIKAEWLYFYMRNRVGRARAVKIEVAVDYMQLHAPGIKERAVRKLYEGLPVCSCPEGRFVPATKAEVDEFKTYLTKGWGPFVAARRTKVIYEYFPEFGDVAGQLGIPFE